MKSQRLLCCVVLMTLMTACSTQGKLQATTHKTQAQIDYDVATCKRQTGADQPSGGGFVFGPVPFVAIATVAMTAAGASAADANSKAYIECMEQRGYKLEPQSDAGSEHTETKLAGREVNDGLKSTFQNPFWIGQWTGDTVRSDGSNLPIKVTSTGVNGNVHYPSLRCGGKLYAEKTGVTYVQFRETIVVGEDRCPSGANLVIQDKGPDSMYLRRYKPGGGLEAEGGLKKLN